MSNKIVSFNTRCHVCDKIIPKKNKKGKFYFCDKCYELSDMDKINKLAEIILSLEYMFDDYEHEEHIFDFINNDDD